MKCVNKSSNVGAQMLEQEQHDETIELVKEVVDPIAIAIDEDNENVRSLFVVVGKAIPAEDGMEAIQSYITMSGDIGVMQEAIYAEMVEQIKNNNNYELFQAFREIIKNIEQELNIDPEEEFDEGPRIVH
jgi:chorismate mutase